MIGILECSYFQKFCWVSSPPQWIESDFHIHTGPTTLYLHYTEFSKTWTQMSLYICRLSWRILWTPCSFQDIYGCVLSGDINGTLLNDSSWHCCCVSGLPVSHRHMARCLSFVLRSWRALTRMHKLSFLILVYMTSVWMHILFIANRSKCVLSRPHARSSTPVFDWSRRWLSPASFLWWVRVTAPTRKNRFYLDLLSLLVDSMLLGFLLPSIRY